MSIDISSFPINPLAVISVAIYVGFSAKVSGPEIIDRELERDGWYATCETKLQADISTWRGPEPLETPKLDCEATFGVIYGDQGKEFCDKYGNFNIPIPGLNLLEEQQRHAREAEERRIARAAAGTASTCTCAQEVFTASQRVAVALYAASGRTITTAALKSRENGLSRALRSPACTQEG